MKSKLFVVMLCLTGAAAMASDVLRVVHEPRQIASVTAKTESAWANCKWCNSKISYERTYKWDVYDQCWVETTKSVPDTCRKCKTDDKRIEKLRREEANLDRKLDEKDSKKRVAEKRKQVRDWTANNR